MPKDASGSCRGEGTGAIGSEPGALNAGVGIGGLAVQHKGGT